MLQFLGMVFPKDLLHYFELTGFEDNIIPEKERLGVESGELVVHLEERDCLRHPEKGHIYRPNGFYEASRVQVACPCPLREHGGVHPLQCSPRRQRFRSADPAGYDGGTREEEPDDGDR